MLTLYAAIIELKTSLEAAFILAGFKDGISLSNEEIKAETDPMFWFLQLTNKDASDKKMYLTYGINSMDQTVHGDGVTLGRKAITTVTLYSRSKNVATQFEALNRILLEKYLNFELDSIIYNSTEQMYGYSFRVEMYIYG